MTGKEVKKLREILGITAWQLGEILGVTENTVLRWECGARQAKGGSVAMMRRLRADREKQKEPVA